MVLMLLDADVSRNLSDEDSPTVGEHARVVGVLPPLGEEYEPPDEEDLYMGLSDDGALSKDGSFEEYNEEERQRW